ncbi:MAG: DUF1364 family protein [Bradyrhizobium sp.]|nr:DUF1364 family protein [Bradyrhizobium sp.]
MTLRTEAHLRDCYVQLPGVCNHNPETTVLAHLRIGHIAGMGQKPPDTCAVPVCSACHDVIDGRAKSDLDRDFVQLLALQGHLRWMKQLDLEGWELLKTGIKRKAA